MPLCRERVHPRPQLPQISAGFPITWASSKSFPFLGDHVRMSPAQLAISDMHASAQISIPATALLAFCKLVH